MSVFLDRVDSVPVINSGFDTQLMQWFFVLVDTLNENISDIQNAIMSTNVVTGITQDVEINSTYIPGNVALTTFQLPDKAVVGSKVAIAGNGAGGWILLTGAGQTIKIASVGSSASVSVASSSRYDSIEIICVVADTTWVALSAQTTGFVIV